MARTSAMRCEMKMTSLPSAASCRVSSSSQSVSRARQRRGRLVEDEDARVLGEPLGDLDDLPLGERQPPQLLVGPQRRESGSARTARASRRRIAARSTVRSAVQRLAAEPDVLLDRQVGDQRQFLEDGGDAARAGRRPDWPGDRAAPSSRIVPSSGRTAPARIWMKVLLPAPFSPSRACTSPARARELGVASARRCRHSASTGR